MDTPNYLLINQAEILLPDGELLLGDVLCGNG